MVMISPHDYDHRNPGANGWCPAFSLLEIIVVLSIVTILSAVIMPWYAGALARYRNDAAARRVVADLERVSKEAMNTSTSHALTFDVSGDNYRLVNIKRFGQKNLANIVELSGEPYYTTIVTAEFEGGDTVVFDGYGNPDKGGSVVIGFGSTQKTIVFDKLSAKATIH